MALPPKGDPRRPLHLAIRSARAFGIIFVLFGCVTLVPLALMVARRGFSLRLMMILPRLASAMIVTLGPGATYLVIAFYLKRQRHWAIVTGIVLASMQLLIALVGGGFFTVFLFSGGAGMEDYLLIPAAIIGLVILALIQLICHLVNSFDAIKHVPIEEQRGFEPLMVEPMDSESFK
ncbi:MAG TPA: hypothetical protein VFC46_16755 [Humisphaera sp.]|nr:hypothetical protein [Humisphaera sp.]